MEKIQLDNIALEYRVHNLPEYILRNFPISTLQSVARLQFNCDGTQIIYAKDFEQFIQQNLP